MNTNFIILILIILVILFFCKDQENFKNIENWINYKELNFNNWETGQTPINFYNRPEYRKPYRWPACHYVDYPIKHCRHLQMLFLYFLILNF